MIEKSTYFLLKSIASLPFWCLYLISDFIAFFLQRIIRYRRKVVRTNLTSSFPEKNIKEIKQIEHKFYQHIGDLVVETLKLLHISDSQLQRRIKVSGYQEINESLSQGHNVALFLAHYANWEWAQEITRYFLPSATMVSIYQPLANKAWDNILIRIRSRWNAKILPSNKALHHLLNRDEFPWVCGFISDQRPGPKTEKNCLEFLNHKTYFVYGTEDLGRRTHADFFYLEMKKVKRGFYEINFKKLSPDESGKPYPVSRAFWHEFEKTIEKAPHFWLWSHKRWR